MSIQSPEGHCLYPSGHFGFTFESGFVNPSMRGSTYLTKTKIAAAPATRYNSCFWFIYLLPNTLRGRRRRLRDNSCVGIVCCVSSRDAIISLGNKSIRAHSSKVSELLNVSLDIDPVVPHHKSCGDGEQQGVNQKDRATRRGL